MDKSLAVLFADFNNTDVEGRVRLNLSGTQRDLEEKGIKPTEGLKVVLDNTDDLAVPAIIQFSISENIWVGKYDEKDFIYR